MSEDAIALIKPYFQHEWHMCTSKEIELTPILGGECNRIWKVIRIEASEGDIEPATVLLKKIGGNVLNIQDFWPTFNPRSQALISYEISKRGLGPKIYGIFQDGSIEEYIQSHHLTIAEAADPDISSDIAIQLARIHSIQNLPIPKNAFDIVISNTLARYHNFQTRSDKFELSKKFDLEEILKFDMEREINWLKKIISIGKFRSNLILTDVNFTNCLVKDNKISDQDSRVMLIDFDGAQINLRGIDLGKHLFARKLSPNGLAISSDDMNSRSQITHFLSCYQNEIKKNNMWYDFDETGIDSVDNLELEANVGLAYNTLKIIGVIMLHIEDHYQGARSRIRLFHELQKHVNFLLER